jgi:hypothetical protein
LIANNSANRGGGIYDTNQKESNIVNSTLYGNAASDFGGAAFFNKPRVKIDYVTMYQNSAPRGSSLSWEGATAIVFNASIAAGIAQGNSQNCYALPGSTRASTISNRSVFSDWSCRSLAIDNPFSGKPFRNLHGVDPQLSALSNNAGPTQTAMPLRGSPVIDYVGYDPSICWGNDQRGYFRPSGAGCDTGAVEVPFRRRPRPIGAATQAAPTDDAAPLEQQAPELEAPPPATE